MDTESRYIWASAAQIRGLHWRQLESFQNSNFHLKAWILSLTTNIVHLPWRDRFTLFIFKKMSSKCSSLNTYGLSVSCSCKQKWYSIKKRLVQFATQNHECLPSRQPPYFQHAAGSALCVQVTLDWGAEPHTVTNPHLTFDSPKTQLLIAHCWLEALTITNNRLTHILHVMCIAYCILTLKGAKENVITRVIQGSTVPTVLPISLKKLYSKVDT